MVFQMKLPGPAPRQRTSARQLAEQSGLDVVLVMEFLAEINEYVTSPTSKSLESPAVDRVLAHFRVPPIPEKVAPVSPWKLRGDEPSPKSRSAVKSLRPSLPTDYRTRFEAPDASAGLGHQQLDAAPAWEMAEWKLYGFSDAERDVWIAQGLRPGQAKTAKNYRDAGLLAIELRVELKGSNVAKRLREGESLADVLRLLRQVRAESDVS